MRPLEQPDTLQQGVPHCASKMINESNYAGRPCNGRVDARKNTRMNRHACVQWKGLCRRSFTETPISSENRNWICRACLLLSLPLGNLFFFLLLFRSRFGFVAVLLRCRTFCSLLCSFDVPEAPSVQVSAVTSVVGAMPLAHGT
jgi:hypothetical protein